MNRVSSQRARACSWACALLLIALAVPAFADEKRAMTFMDVIEMRAVGAGKLSPDGKYVVYTVSIPQWKAGKNFTDLFVAATDGSGPPRQMTFTKEKNETQPQWARDSRTLGFLSDRDAQNQLYLMRVDGGEARKVSDAKDGVHAFAFSRDGRWVAYSAGKPEERQLWLASLESEGAPLQLTHHATPLGEWAWSPDSSRIFFLAPDSVDKDDEKRKEKKFDVRIMDPERSPSHLWSVAVADKSEKRWTSGSAYGVEQFRVSPDGAFIAFRSESPDRHANRLDRVDSEIYTIELSTGGIRRITSNKVEE
ncbi:MAG TPA: LpqB family beta-propeller domain-containing protein, partial [Candidatus Acidoferrales bacterium]|nr:LpqB family beta-propeller domain-containing protein [Candidatus Acidoferrales bacterium]